MKIEDTDNLLALSSKAEQLRTYEEPLGADLGEFADATTELITELYARLALLEGDWNPAKKESRPKEPKSLRSDPTEDARTRPEPAYVIARAVLPDGYWNKAPMFHTFVRVLYAIEHDGASLPVGDSKSAIKWLTTKGELKYGTGLLDSWEWGMTNWPRRGDRFMKNWIGAVFWTLKSSIRGEGVTKKVADLLLNNMELRAYIARAAKRAPSGPAGNYQIASGILDWCDIHGFLKR